MEIRSFALLLISICDVQYSLGLTPDIQERIDRMFIDFYAFLPEDSYMEPDCRVRMHNILQIIIRRM
uniref:Androgen receptor n=1 Tax=Romanomermis culicivorax TaxID=13658 RepID=A0A915K8P5_ROMCU